MAQFSSNYRRYRSLYGDRGRRIPSNLFKWSKRDRILHVHQQQWFLKLSQIGKQRPRYDNRIHTTTSLAHSRLPFLQMGSCFSRHTHDKESQLHWLRFSCRCFVERYRVGPAVRWLYWIRVFQVEPKQLHWGLSHANERLDRRGWPSNRRHRWSSYQGSRRLFRLYRWYRPPEPRVAGR